MMPKQFRTEIDRKLPWKSSTENRSLAKLQKQYQIRIQYRTETVCNRHRFKHVLEITKLTNVNKDKYELPLLGLESLLLTIVWAKR